MLFKKKLKQVLAVALSVSMLGSTAVLFASAAEEEKKPDTYNYVALGDSIASGFGVNGDGTFESIYSDPALILSEELIADPVKEAYPAIFGEYVKQLAADRGYTATVTNLSSTAYRAEDVEQTILNEGYVGLIAAYILGEDNYGSIAAYHDIYNKYLPEADLVSIQLGGNDILLAVVFPMLMEDNPVLQAVAVSLLLSLVGCDNETSIGAGVLMLSNQRDKIDVETVTYAIRYLVKAFKDTDALVETAAQNVQKVVQAVKSVNPTTDIAVVGMFNPYGNSLELDGKVHDYAYVMTRILIRAINEAVDADVDDPGENVAPLPEGNEEEVIQQVEAHANELSALAAWDNYISDATKARLMALLNIVISEISYPLQYQFAGKTVDSRILKLNQLLAEIAEEEGATFVDVYGISNEDNLDPHPTAQGHKEIAECLEAGLTDVVLSRMPVDRVMGDLNGDGEFSIEDVTVLQRHLAEFEQIPRLILPYADMNGDGVVDVRDVTKMQRLLAQLA